MKTKLTLFITVLAAALFGMGCASTEPTSDPLKKGLVAYYPFNGNSLDESGNGHDGVVNGAALSLDRNGAKNSAYFLGGDDSIVIKDNSDLNPMPLTISLWCKSAVPGSKISSQGLVTKYRNANWLGYAVFWSSGRVSPMYTTNSTGGSYLMSGKGDGEFVSGDLADDNWHHIVFSVDPKGGILFVDGKVVSFKNWHGKPEKAPPSGDDLRIGYYPDGPGRPEIEKLQYFKGSIDDVRIYSRALSVEEVKALYDLEKPKTK
jgi:hypothetical protein